MNRSLATQFRLGMAVVVVLVAGVSGAGFWIAGNYRHDIDVAYKTYLANSLQLAEAQLAHWQLRFGLRQYAFAAPEEQQQIIKEQDDLYVIVENRLAAYNKSVAGVEESSAHTNLLSAYLRYKQTRSKYFELWDAGEKDDAIAWVALTVTPFGAEAARAFATQIALQRSLGEREQASAESDVRIALTLVTATTITLLALLVISYAYLVRLLRPIRALRAQADRVLREQFGESLAASASLNEVTALEKSFQLMSERLLASRNRLALATASANIGVWDWDVVANNFVWDARMYALYGIREQDFSGAYDAWQAGLHPDERERGDVAIKAALNGDQDFNIEFRVLWPNGEVHDIESHAMVERAGDGSATRMIGVHWDITERKRLDWEREKFVALIENSGDFIGMATLEGKPFYLNRAGRELVGLDPEFDVSFTSIPEYFDEDTAALLQNAAIPATFATGGWTGEGRLRHFRTHALIQVHINSILVKDRKTGQPICIATIERNITDIKDAEMKLEKANRELLDVSRQAGMAEIATSVLHNVGNVLNSVNVSADRIAEKVKRLSPASLVKVAALLRDHAHDLSDFLARDPRGKELPGYLSALVEQLSDPQKEILPEVVSLRKNVEHIREIVRMQQNYARATSVVETAALTDLVEDAIRINAAALSRHAVHVIREYSPVPAFPIEKHKVLQILVNLLSNAKNALDAGGGVDSKLTVRVGMNGGGTAKISVIDNGAGIAPENLTRIFQHGFTTRKDGHGFGLHSGALAAQEMGGSLTAHSDGQGKGAAFTLELPCGPAEGNL